VKEDPPAGTFTKVASGSSHACALSTTGEIVCWGAENYFGEAEAPEGLYIDVAAGVQYSCAITNEGHADCWG
jgi:alpha-tubulin suppressor-like RCC1 family protein